MNKIITRNDTVYGIIPIPNYALDVIHTPIFQRLSRILQLGSLNKIWYSANHTRLEHSIGCMHLANIYSDFLKFGDTIKKSFILASLLHDIGHGPFSHIFENSLTDKTLLEKYKNHDEWRFTLLFKNPELYEAIKESADNIALIWSGKTNDPYLKICHTLLAGIAGVDRMDYIIRDSYYLLPHKNLHYSCIQNIIYNTIIDPIKGLVIYTEKGEKYINYLLDNRYFLYKEIYSHWKSHAADYLIQLSFINGMESTFKKFIDPIKFEQFDDDYIRRCSWYNKKYSKYLKKYQRNQLPKLIKSKKHNFIFKKSGKNIASNNIKKILNNKIINIKFNQHKNIYIKRLFE